MPVVTTDVIRVVVEVDEKVRGLPGAKRGIMSLKPLGAAVGRGIGTSLAAGFAFAAGAAGIGLLSRGIIGLQSEVQDTEVGIAALLSSTTGEGIAKSLERAGSIVKQLREDAAVGAGELGNYADGFQRIVGPALRAGASLKEIRELNKLALGAGFAQRGAEGLRLAPLDVLQALTKGVSDIQTPIVTQLLPSIGLTNEAFNKLSKRDRFDALVKAFGTMKEGAEAMGKTFSAQTATLQDNVKEIIRQVTRPVFDLWTRQLETANNWMESNRDAMKEMAEVWGPRVAGVFAKISGDPGTALGFAGAGIGAAGVGRFAASGGLGLLGGAVGGGAAAGGGILAGILLPLGAAFLGIKGALAETPALAEATSGALALLGKSFGIFFDSISSLSQEGSLLNVLGGGLIIAFNTSINVFARGIMVVSAGITLMGNSLVAMRHLFEGIALGLGGNLTLAAQSFSLFRSTTAAAGDTFGRDLRKALFDPVRVTRVKGVEGDDDDLGGLNTQQGNVNIGKVVVTVKAEIGEDPNRVAAAFDTILSSVNQFRTQARTAPLSPQPL